MYNFVRRGAYMLLIAGLTMGVAGCSDDDPDYDNVTPPVVEVCFQYVDRSYHKSER